jgi:hypothetical protein
MVRAQYHNHIRIEDGHVVRYVCAVWPATRKREGGELDVYRIDDEGREEVRNLCYIPICGYMVDPPEKGYKPYPWSVTYTSCKAFKEDNVGHFDWSAKEGLEKMVQVYPEFRYTLQKAGEVRLAEAMRLLIDWKKEPKTELLVGAGYKRLIHNGNFARMTPTKQKEVLSFIRKTEGAELWTLQKVLFVLNKRGTAEDFDAWQKFKLLYGNFTYFCDFRWFKKYGPDHDLLVRYNDYMNMAKRCGHNLKEDYWKYPSDINKAHDKVMNELKRVLKLEKQAREERAREIAKIKKNKSSYFAKISAIFDGKTARKNGFIAFVPANITAVIKQAKALNQCLMTCDYPGKMARKECLLVFIADRKGNPIATAELTKQGKVNQFYGDEKNRDIKIMKPGAKVHDALNSWLDKYKADVTKALKGAA